MRARLSVVQKNIVASLLGQGWSFAIGLITIPFYIKFLGIEAYGLIGIYATIQAMLNTFLDFGFSVTLNRELARASASGADAGETRDLVRTMEVIYWFIGLALGAMVCLAAGFLATYWVQSENLPVPLLTTAFLIMGAIIFAQWPLTFYQSGLIGLQKLVLVNAVNTLVGTLRGLGAVLLLWLVAPSVTLFFTWQAAMALLQVVLTAALLWHRLPASERAPRFRLSRLKGVWRFAAGMTVTQLLAAFTGQADRIILSKLLRLEYFGYYSLAFTLNGQFRLIAGQILQAIFPRFSSLVAADDLATLRSVYHRAQQLVAVVVTSIGGTAIVFAPALIGLWLQDPQIARNVAPIAMILLFGSILGDLVGTPHQLTVAYGWAKFSVLRSAATLALLIPLMVIFATRFGGLGAAWAFTLVSLAGFALIPPIVHRRLLRGELGRWYVAGVAVPGAAAIAVLLVARMLRLNTQPALQGVAFALAAAGMAALCAALTIPDFRTWLAASLPGHHRPTEAVAVAPGDPVHDASRR